MAKKFNFASLLPREQPLPKSDLPSRTTTRKQPLHILNEKNLIRFIEEQERTKPYEMKIRFYKSSSNEIQKLLDKLFQEKKLERNRNGWISLIEDKKEVV
ncbi:MAG: hypothetical protein ACFFDF_12865 [Candidatus Odinarchaeota archaeon]